MDSRLDAAALRAFQTSEDGLDWEGRPLVADGKLGPRTLWALAIADLPRHRRAIVRTACSQVGVQEHPLGSNRGVEVDGYLKPAGIGYGHPWCAAFVSWVLREALGVEAAPKFTASAAACIRQLRPAVGGPMPGSAVALPGDVFGWVNPDGTGHVGFVIGSATGRDDVITCEGNSGNRVRVCQRPRAGLSFGVVEQPLVLVRAEVPATAAVLLQRSSEGTR